MSFGLNFDAQPAQLENEVSLMRRPSLTPITPFPSF